MAGKTRWVHKQNYPSNKFPFRALGCLLSKCAECGKISLFFSFTMFNVQCTYAMHVLQLGCAAELPTILTTVDGTKYFIARSIHAFHFLFVSTTEGIILFRDMFFFFLHFPLCNGNGTIYGAVISTLDAWKMRSIQKNSNPFPNYSIIFWYTWYV